jgi:hypothetical protein
LLVHIGGFLHDPSYDTDRTAKFPFRSLSDARERPGRSDQQRTIISGSAKRFPNKVGLTGPFTGH